MDFRQFFHSFFNLNEELEGFFEESLLNKDLHVFLSDSNEKRKATSPRDMMLKSKPERHDSFVDILDPENNSFQSKSFVKTFSSDNEGSFQEKIIIKDSDDVEKIITKHSSGGRTTQKEIVRKGNQIISEKEVTSDIGNEIGFNPNKDGNYDSNQSPEDNYSGFWNWFK